jgi:hypothetical protein
LLEIRLVYYLSIGALDANVYEVFRFSIEILPGAVLRPANPNHAGPTDTVISLPPI